MEQIKINDHPLYKAHNIDSAMSSLWTFYKNKFIPLFLMSLVMGLIIQYISSLIKFEITDYQSFDINQMMLQLKKFFWPMLIVSLISLLFTVILQHYVIFNPLDQENNAGRSVLNSFRYYIPYLIILVFLSIAGALAMFIGLLMLLVGALFSAIYIMTIYIFILPVLIVEGTNIANAIGRTVTLAHRNFWSNIGWTAVFVIIILVITTIISGIILIPFTGSFLNAIRNPEEATTMLEITSNPFYIILSALLNAVTMPLLPIFSAIMYFNGRAREENRYQPYPSSDIDEKVRVEDLYAKPREESDDD